MVVKVSRKPHERERDSPYWQQLFDAERQILRFTFEHTRSLAAGARLLRVSRQFLANRLKVLSLEHLVDTALHGRTPPPPPAPEGGS